MTRFDPRGEREPEPSLIPRQTANSFHNFFIVFMLFLVVRSAMLVGGMAIINIPILDSLLIKILRIFL